jgi:hypothetical protein
VVGFPLLLLLLGLIFGAALGVLFWATFPLAALSWLAFFRSLNPRFRGDALTFTTYGARGSAFGPPTAGGVALSLIPVHETGFTRWLMRIYMYGWQPTAVGIIGMVPAGVALVLMVCPVLDPSAPVAVRIVAAAAVAGLVTWSAVWVRRDWRSTFFPTEEEMSRRRPRADDGRIRDERTGKPLDELTRQQRLERVKRLRAEREARIKVESE